MDVEKELNIVGHRRTCLEPIYQNVIKNVVLENEATLRPRIGKWKRLARSGNQDKGLNRECQVEYVQENGKKRVLV